MRVLLTGCASAGKSTLLAALGDAHYSTVPEPGRRIVADVQANGGTALPWVDPVAFAQRAAAMAREDLRNATQLPPPVIFDRGLLDAAVALEHFAQIPLAQSLPDPFPYDLVMLAPPWPDIYVTDADRPHGLEDARSEYARISEALARLGITPVILPMVSVLDRVRFVREKISK